MKVDLVFIPDLPIGWDQVSLALFEEGGDWIPASMYLPDAVHAVRTKDGRVWDSYSGWRTGRVAGWYRNEMG